MSFSPEHWMQKACELAQQAGENDEVPVGAVLVCNGEIIGEGRNTRERSNRTTAHAEIIAVENFNERFGNWRVPSGTSLYVTVEPCLMCTGALLWARVEDIYFGCEDPKGAGLMRILPLIEKGLFDHRFQQVKEGILEKECASTITSFFVKKRLAKKTQH